MSLLDRATDLLKANLLKENMPVSIGRPEGTRKDKY
jgi:hypothetical protein